jgi:hypothetical protein
MEPLKSETTKLRVEFASKRGDSFYLFPSLPMELRLQIWYHAIDALPPRIIDVRAVTNRDAKGKDGPVQFVSRSGSYPRLASVNKEA